MIAAIWVSIAVLSLLVFLLGGALVEMYRDLRQMREGVGLLDLRNKLEVAVDAAQQPGVGLPEDLMTREWALLVVLSDRCNTCNTLASSLGGRVPEGVWVTVVAFDENLGNQWLRSHDLERSDRVALDAKENVLETLGTRVTPAAIRFHYGTVITAHTLPSERTLAEEIEWLSKGGYQTPAYMQRT